MTEIPEHLLQRSRERRAALGLGGDAPAPASGGESTSAPAAATPATGGGAQPPATPTPAAPPAEPKPEPPKPVPAYVQAAQRRRRIPFWAMPVLAALPLWGYVYIRTLSPAPVENDPVTLGGEIYSGKCAQCHGGTGAGGGAPQLSDGHVLKTWKDYRDHMMWVKLGAQDWPGSTYGDHNTSKEANGGVMPSFSILTDQELAQVVLYERRELSGEKAPDPAKDELLQIANGEKTFKDAGLGDTSKKDGVSEDELGK